MPKVTGKNLLIGQCWSSLILRDVDDLDSPALFRAGCPEPLGWCAREGWAVRGCASAIKSFGRDTSWSEALANSQLA